MAFVAWRYRFGDLARIDIQCPRIDVDEDRLGADQADRLGRGEKREGSCNHLVAWADAEGPQPDDERVGPRIASDGLLDRQELGHLLFEGPDLRSEDELSRPHHLGDGRLNLVPEQVNFGS